MTVSVEDLRWGIISLISFLFILGFNISTNTPAWGALPLAIGACIFFFRAFRP